MAEEGAETPRRFSLDESCAGRTIDEQAGSEGTRHESMALPEGTPKRS